MQNSIRIILMALTLLLAGCATHEHIPYQSPYRPVQSLSPGEIMHVQTGTLLTGEELFNYLSPYRVVYVGESHKNLKHHEVQLQVIKALNERYPGEIVVGMEMFQRPAQEFLDKWISGEADDKEFFKEWMKNWGVDYEYYKGVLEYIGDNRIPLIALNVSNKRIRTLIHKEKGKSHSKKKPEGGGDGETVSVKETDNEKDKPAKVEEPLPELDETDPYHRAWVEAVYSDPSHGSSGFEGFYRVQLMWEETMAETIANYLRDGEGKGKRMVVLAGGGHLGYGFGIPKRAFRRLMEPYTVIMPVSTEIITDKKAGEKKGAKYLDIDMPNFPLLFADIVWGTEYQSVPITKPKLGVYLVEEENGVTVSLVTPGSPAEKHDIFSGDIIKALDGEEVKEIYDIVYTLSLKEFNDTVLVSVYRDGDDLEIEVKLTPEIKQKTVDD